MGCGSVGGWVGVEVLCVCHGVWVRGCVGVWRFYGFVMGCGCMGVWVWVEVLCVCHGVWVLGCVPEGGADGVVH